MFKPSTQVEGGAVEFDGTIVSAKVGAFTYQSGQETLGLILQIRDDDAGALRKYPDNYSIGGLAHYAATENGLGILNAKEERKGEPAVLTSNSRAGQFFAAAVKAGLDETKMEYQGDANNVKFLEGLRFHFALTELPTKDGTSKVILPVKLLGAAAGQAAAPAAGAPAAVDTAQAVRDAIVELLTEAEGNKLPKSKLSTAVPAKVPNILKTSVVKLVISDAFLKGIDGVKFDGKELSL